MSSTRTRAWHALTDQLRELAPDASFVGGTHTLQFARNLVPGLTDEQVEAVRTQLKAGAGNELTPTDTGKRRAHAPYSSAALAASTFGRWVGFESELRIAGLGGFSAPLTIEQKLKISHGGGTANLDCGLTDPGLIVGVESKLTETLTAHKPVRWAAAYKAREMSQLLDRSWRKVLGMSLNGKWQPKYVGLEQLIKHALALSSMEADQRELLYVYWEPANAEDHAEVLGHRQELDRLRSLLGDCSPGLRAMTHAELWASWEAEAGPAWLPEHVAQLRQRYDIDVAVGS